MKHPWTPKPWKMKVLWPKQIWEKYLQTMKVLGSLSNNQYFEWKPSPGLTWLAGESTPSVTPLHLHRKTLAGLPALPGEPKECRSGQVSGVLLSRVIPGTPNNGTPLWYGNHWYCWSKKSCTSWGKGSWNPIIFNDGVWYIPPVVTVAGFLNEPSNRITVFFVWDLFF